MLINYEDLYNRKPPYMDPWPQAISIEGTGIYIIMTGGGV